MYVWCDALTNYLTSAKSKGEEFWTNTKMLNVIGKDILRFHALYWPAMLMSAKERLPQNILVHGMILSDGQKMSKTIGNVIDPLEVVNLYNRDLADKSLLGEEIGSEFFRYYFLKNISPFLDGDFTFERAKELYNADLANGIGNLISRVMRLSEKYLEKSTMLGDSLGGRESIVREYRDAMNIFDVKTAFEKVFELVSEADRFMQKNEPFKVIKVDEEQGKKMLKHLRESFHAISHFLKPFMPKTAEIIEKITTENKMPEKPLFPRYE
jgi:methionyl-tRNA synthetase